MLTTILTRMKGDIMKKVLCILALTVILAGCAPSPEAIEKALAQTQTAIALLSTNTPTITNTPTETSTPTPTNTPEPTFTPTPDLRIIDGDPYDFALTRDDLPKESQYFLPDSSWTGRHSNNEVIGGWGVDEGQEYLKRTGRIDGWWVELYRGSEILKAPQNFYCNVVEYETTEGAQISLLDYNVIAYPDRASVEYLLAKEVFPELGDTRIAYYYEYMADSGEKEIYYNIESTYYNFLVSCFGWGRKVEVEPDFVANVVKKIIDKMKAAPLITP